MPIKVPMGKCFNQQPHDAHFMGLASEYNVLCTGVLYSEGLQHMIPHMDCENKKAHSAHKWVSEELTDELDVYEQEYYCGGIHIG